MLEKTIANIGCAVGRERNLTTATKIDSAQHERSPMFIFEMRAVSANHCLSSYLNKGVLEHPGMTVRVIMATARTTMLRCLPVLVFCHIRQVITATVKVVLHIHMGYIFAVGLKGKKPLSVQNTHKNCVKIRKIR